ncbi:acyltransferase family protein [Nocardia takedensis]|uniref:acyltransferase family protein n=1 Tax=Nocardia takedensis TaxID=259390 RepID=UPI000319E2F7|nr:acyltransferase family protein [Nocardia takedensis]
MFAQTSNSTTGPGPTAGSGSRVARRSGAGRRPDDAAYRHDLDGLRGVAIALVVGFHVWLGRVSGGVDVFLVLSGFFFTGMLLRRVESDGRVAVGATLRRTARRLLPALFVVLAGVLLVTALTRPYTQWADISAQTLASALYYQNWYLAGAELTYAAADPSVSPLQHLWSMAIQGQFYLAALLVVAAWAILTGGLRPVARRGTLLVLVAALGAVSFWYAAAGSDRHQAWNYYDSGARAWELLAGAAVAIVLPGSALARPIRVLLAALGLAAVLSCGVLFDGANLFPGPSALFPVLAAVALILAGSGKGGALPWPNRVLASRPCVELGDLAYALYLWHWPLLIFWLANNGQRTPGLTDGLLIVGCALVLAWLTRALVESPLRVRSGAAGTSRPGYRRAVGAVIVATGLTVLGGAFGWQMLLRANPAHPPQALDIEHYPGAATLLSDAVQQQKATMRPTVFEAAADAPSPTYDGCITPNREVRVCTYGDQAASRAIAVVGGSHSEHWLPAFEMLGRDRGFRVVTYLKEGCPLTLSDQPSYAEYPFPECREWTEEVLDRLAETRPDWVFTTATRYRMHADGDEVPPEYLDVWSALSDRGLRVLAVRDTPRLRRDGVFYRAVDCLAHRGTAFSCGVERSSALDPRNPADEPASAYPNVFPFDMSDAICRPDRCRVVEGNILIYRDEHHLTASYARSLAPELGRRLGELTQWW